MNSLFKDLYKRRRGEGRDNREDWLTECLAAVIRSLPPDRLASFFASLTGEGAATISAVAEDLSVTTQRQIGATTAGKRELRPDMIVSIRGTPWIVFENKVAHSIGESTSLDGSPLNQLDQYAGWLKEQRSTEPPLRKTLLLVTHHTRIPPQFMTKVDAERGEPSRAALTWASLARRLAAATVDLDPDSHARALSGAYLEFLKEHGMANDYPEFKEFAGLGMFVESADRFRKLIDEMIGRTDDVAPFQGNVRWADADAQEGTFRAWRYLAEEERYDGWTYLATGIWFPDLGDGWYADAITDEVGETPNQSPKVYLQLANHQTGALDRIKGLPNDDWIRPDGDLLTLRDVSRFPNDPTDRAVAIFSWLDLSCEALRMFLKR